MSLDDISFHITKFHHGKSQADKQHHKNKNTAGKEIYGDHFLPPSSVATLK